MEGSQFWKGVRGLDPLPPSLPCSSFFGSPSFSYFSSVGKARAFEIAPKSVFNLVSVVSGNLDFSSCCALSSPQSDNFDLMAVSPVKSEKEGKGLVGGRNGEKVVNRQGEAKAEMSDCRSMKALSKGGNSSGSMSSVDQKPDLGLAVVQSEIQLQADTVSLLRHLSSLSIPSTTSIYVPKEERQAATNESLSPAEAGTVTSSEEVFCKNLFLKDRRGQFYLVVCREETNADLRTLKKELKACRNFSFGTAAELSKELGVPPGCVTPFAFFSPSRIPPGPAGHPECSSSADPSLSSSVAPTSPPPASPPTSPPPASPPSVRMAVARSLLNDPSILLNFHPLDLSLTTAIRSDHLKPFLQSCGVVMETVDL